MSAGRALPLARVPYPCPSEHPAGYLRRLAEANGFFTLRQLRLLHGVEPLSPRSEPVAWQRLSRATALTMETFSLLQWKRMTTAGGTWLSVCGHAVRLADLDLFHLRICPLCIHANGVVRAEWSMRHVTACPIHEVQLLDRCPNCGRPALADERTDVWNCGQCGSDRRHTYGAPAQADELALARAIFAAFAKPSEPMLNEPSDFLSLPVGSMAAIIARLAEVSRLYSAERANCAPAPRIRQHPPDMAAATDQARRAWHLLTEWPERYLETLLFLADTSVGPAGHRIRDRFATPAGKLAVRPLRDQDAREIVFLSVPTLGFLHDALGIVPRARAPGAAARARVPRNPAIDTAPISHSAAMLRLEGRANDRLARWWIEAGLLDEHIADDGSALLSAIQVSELASRIEAFATAQPVNSQPVDVGWIDRHIAASRSFRKSHFLSALTEGSIAAWRVSDAPGLAGFHFDSREILRLRAEAQLRAWADADDHVSLSRFNAEACSVWGPKAQLDMRECDKLARLGRITMTRYEPPGDNSRRQKRWSARDLIAHAEQGRTRLIDAQGDDQARHKPPMERKRKPRL